MRPLKFKMSDTTLTSDVNQTLSNLLSQTNKVKAKVEIVSQVANSALSTANAPISFEDLTDVLIKAVQIGQVPTWNGSDWVNETPEGASFSTAGQGAFYGPGILNPYGLTMAYASLGSTAQELYVFQFTLNASWTIRAASFISQNSGANYYYGFGIYSAAGAALVKTSFLSGNITSGAGTNTFSAVTLPPGTYYFAQAVDTSALSAPTFEFIFGGGSPTEFLAIANADSQNIVCTAANKMGVNTGVMPSTLGTLTPITTAPSIAAVKWNP